VGQSPDVGDRLKRWAPWRRPVVVFSFTVDGRAINRRARVARAAEAIAAQRASLTRCLALATMAVRWSRLDTLGDQLAELEEDV